MISELLPGLTLMVLFGPISGRSTGTRLFAASWLRRKIWVTIWLDDESEATGPAFTGLPSSLASASGTTLYRPSVSTSEKPCRRGAAPNGLGATAGGTGGSGA